MYLLLASRKKFNSIELSVLAYSIFSVVVLLLLRKTNYKKRREHIERKKIEREREITKERIGKRNNFRQ